MKVSPKNASEPETTTMPWPHMRSLPADLSATRTALVFVHSNTLTLTLVGPRMGFINALEYPFSNDESKYGPVLKLSLTVLLSVLIVPFFVVTGYIYRVLENAIRDEPMPRFKEPVALAKEGIKAGVVVGLPLFAVQLLPALVALTAGKSVGVLLAYVFYAGSLVVTPALAGMYARSRTFAGTYDIGRLRQLLTSKSYIMGLIGFLFFTGIVLPVLLAIPSMFIFPIPIVMAISLTVSQAYLGEVLSGEFETGTNSSAGIQNE